MSKRYRPLKNFTRRLPTATSGIRRLKVNRLPDPFILRIPPTSPFASPR